MKRIFWLSICLLFISAFSCKKDNSVNNNPEPAKEKPKQCRITSGPSFNFNRSIFFKYNTDSSIKSVSAFYGLYEYNYEKGALKSVSQNSYFYPIDSFETDRSGKITSRHLYDAYDKNEPNANTLNVWYIYNSQNKIVRVNYELPLYRSGTKPYTKIYGAYYYLYNEKGNIIKEIDSVQNADGIFKLNYTALYEYDDMKNPYYLMPLYALWRNSNLITMSANNIKRKQEFYENGNAPLTTYSYTYTKEGYPDNVTEYYPQTNDSARYQYTYECK